MSMWVSAEAIDAEVEYRREQNIRLAGLARIGRQFRAERSARRRSARLGRDEAQRGGGGRTPGGGTARTTRHRETTLPAQRTSGSSPATKQPVRRR